MRLINCENGLFEEFFFNSKPPYAILSHTWNEHEITFQEYYDFQAKARHPEASNKISTACKKAYSHGLKYVWIDSCCIDKTSSSELVESINSMFQWYEESEVCYVYLSDFDSGLTQSRAGNPIPFTPEQITNFKNCRWFSRGWTLQELLAPRNVMFYDSQWMFFGRMEELALTVANITRIPPRALSHETPLYNYTIAQKMSWAALRSTTREEDMAHCLFGLFNVNLPLFYGEGGRRAFIRLQEAIMKETNDLSLFAWASESDEFYRGVLARSAKEFHYAGQITSLGPISTNPEFTMTNKGLKIEMELLETTGGVFLILNCCGSTPVPLGIHLKYYGGTWIRDFSNTNIVTEAHGLTSAVRPASVIYIIKDVKIPTGGQDTSSESRTALVRSQHNNRSQVTLHESATSLRPSMATLSPVKPLFNVSFSDKAGDPAKDELSDHSAGVMARSHLRVQSFQYSSSRTG